MKNNLMSRRLLLCLTLLITLACSPQEIIKYKVDVLPKVFTLKLEETGHYVVASYGQPAYEGGSSDPYYAVQVRRVGENVNMNLYSKNANYRFVVTQPGQYRITLSKVFSQNEDSLYLQRPVSIIRISDGEIFVDDLYEGCLDAWWSCCIIL
jgi:hypothetical protein